jgi:hypothetical protein
MLFQSTFLLPFNMLPNIPMWESERVYGSAKKRQKKNPPNKIRKVDCIAGIVIAYFGGNPRGEK